MGGPATLRFRGRELFLSAGDLPEVALDLHQCEASVVGKCLDVLDTSRNLGFSTRNPGVYARLQEVAPEELSEELTAMAGLLYQSKKSESQVYWFGGMTLILLLVGGFFFLSHVTRNVIDWVPIEVDQTIGEPIHEMMLQEYEVVDDPVLLQATGEIFDSLLPHLPIEGLEPHWTLVKNP